MSLKKALGMGVASAALGISLIGGGTFAAFSDTETAENSYAAGTLNLELKKLNGSALGSGVFESKLANLKPGDSVTKKFLLTNAGTLSIKDVFFQATYENGDYKDGNDSGNPLRAKIDSKYLGAAFTNSADEFADQIKVEVYGGDPVANPSHSNRVWEGTLKDLKTKWTPDITSETSNHSLPALPVDTDGVTIKFTFNKDAGNKFQGDTLSKIKFQFNAVQFSGTEFNDGANIENENASQTERR